MPPTILEGAFEWVRQGFYIIPAHNKVSNILDWPHRRSRDPEQVRKWWRKWPSAQIGLLTGSINGLFVLDVDGSEADAFLAKLNLPETFTVETRAGRRHFYFAQPEQVTTKNKVRFAPTLDCRGDGGYVIAPPSIHHETGRPYRVVKNLPWGAMSVELIRVAAATNGTVSTVSTTTENTTEPIPEGQRHDTLTRKAGSMRRKDFSASEIRAALGVMNLERCKPPLPLSEVERIALDIGRKPAGRTAKITGTTSKRVELEFFSESPREKLEWLCRGRVPRGKLTIFAGMPGLGKSLTTIDLAAHVSREMPFPDGCPCLGGGVLILSAEDNPFDTVGPRLDAAGADCSRVCRIKAVHVTLPDGAEAESTFDLGRDLEQLEDELKKHPDIVLIIVDPIGSYLHGVDTHRDLEVRAALQPLIEFAQRSRTAVIGVMHLRKSEAEALLRVSGSVAFVAVARCVWGFGEHPDDETRRVMLPLANKIGPRGVGLSFQIATNEQEDPFIVWDTRPVALDPNVILGGSQKHRRETESLDEACDYLREALAGGPVPGKEVIAQARRDGGIAVDTLRRAKHKLGVKSFKNGLEGCWCWQLPAEDAVEGAEDGHEKP